MSKSRPLRLTLPAMAAILVATCLVPLEAYAFSRRDCATRWSSCIDACNTGIPSGNSSARRLCGRQCAANYHHCVTNLATD